MSTTAKVVISAQVPATVRAELERRAELADRTLSAEVRRALTEHLATLREQNA